MFASLDIFVRHIMLLHFEWKDVKCLKWIRFGIAVMYMCSICLFMRNDL